MGSVGCAGKQLHCCHQSDHKLGELLSVASRALFGELFYPCGDVEGAVSGCARGDNQICVTYKICV